MKTMLYQLTQQSHIQMMSYVLQTGGGDLAVIDGGETEDAEYLLDVLTKLAGGKPKITGWFLTHPHSDHINAMLELFRHHREKFDVEKIYYHFPAPEFVHQYERGAYHTMVEFEELSGLFSDKLVTVSEGDIITIGSGEEAAVFEVLYTTDPSFCTEHVVNNTSAVYRMTASGCSVLFLGDLGPQGGVKLLTHAEKLPSDIVQMAHHGQSGVERAVYQAITPHACLWNAPLWLWENNQGNRGYNSGPWKIFQVRSWMEELGVSQHAVTKDGTAAVTLENGEFSINIIKDKTDPLYAAPSL